MMEQLENYAARVVVRIQSAGAEVDPDILQLPGGSVIATLLWLYTKGADVYRRHEGCRKHEGCRHAGRKH